MPPVRSLDAISDKWARVVAVSSAEYEEGVRNPGADWATETQKAEPAYASGVQKAISEKRFGAGVRAAGTSKWQNRTLTVGIGRWIEGVSVSRPAYEAGFAPYREVIISTTLPARGAKGDPKNINRVAVLAKALHDKKMGSGGRP